jgi:hypothetical protein
MALFLLENRDFLEFRMSLFLIVNSIEIKFEKIWFSGILNIIRKPKKSLFSKRNVGQHNKNGWRGIMIMCESQCLSAEQ